MKAKKKSPGKKKASPKKRKAAGKRKPARKPFDANAGMHDAREVVRERRFEVRTLVSNMTFAAVSFKTEGFGAADFSFSVDLSGLLVDTSAGGCSLIFMQANPAAGKLVREMRCLIQVNPQELRLATVRWVKDLDGRLRNAGFAFT